jgi:hypothetical protein
MSQLHKSCINRQCRNAEVWRRSVDLSVNRTAHARSRSRMRCQERNEGTLYGSMDGRGRALWISGVECFRFASDSLTGVWSNPMMKWSRAVQNSHLSRVWMWIIGR